MKTIVIIAAFALGAMTLPSTLIAQMPDPTSFFPHHLGDMWEYFVLDGVGNDTLQVRVIFDSTDPSGMSHVRHRRELLNPTRPPWFPWYQEFRIDTSANVFGSGFLPPNSLVYRFDAKVGQWWFVYYQGGPGGDVAKVLGEHPATIFGQPTTVKEIGYYSTSDTSDTTIWLAQYGEEIAEGFGTVFRGGADLGYNLYLRGCVIDGIVYGDTILVSVPEYRDTPEQFALHQNYPNPFNPQTKIRFAIARKARVSLVIYDLLGKEMIRLINQEVYPAGVFETNWNGDTHNGIPAASGVYILRLQADGETSIKKMLLLR